MRHILTSLSCFGTVALLLSSPSATAQITLSATTSNHGGYAISCFGGNDGSIDLSVSGGTAPYAYIWSNSAQTQDVSGLVAGFYSVRVTDAVSNEDRLEINLTEPAAIHVAFAPYEYGNGYNVSCYDCYNGAINTTVEGGVTPYTYLWGDGSTTKDRTGLGADNHNLTVTDANGCVYKPGAVNLRQPDRNDWTMNGNADTNPATQYIGTSDNKDVVFKSNGAEGLRLLSAGGARVPSLTFANGYQLVVADSTGKLKTLTDELANIYSDQCALGGGFPWTYCGNQAPTHARLGTRNAVALRLITDNSTRIHITPQGKVGIGTVPPTGAVEDYRLYVEDGIATRDVLVKSGTWPDFVFDEAYHLLSFDELRAFIGRNKHLPGVHAANEVKDGVEVGDMQRRLLQLVEEQALYILQLEERLRAVEVRTANTTK